MIRVQQLMTQSVHSCRPDDSLECAARAMWDHDVGAVPVVDDAGRVVAMVTDRDACMAAYFTGKPLSEIPVRDAMSKSIFAVHPADLVAQAEDVMRENQVRRVPVIDAEGRLVGILSQNDLIREAARERESSRKEITAVEVATTLGAISRPRYGQLSTTAA